MGYSSVNGIDVIISLILDSYRGGWPSRQRLDCMITRFSSRFERAAIERGLQQRMGFAYPRRAVRR